MKEQSKFMQMTQNFKNRIIHVILAEVIVFENVSNYVMAMHIQALHNIYI